MADTNDDKPENGEDGLFSGNQSGRTPERKGESLDQLLRDSDGGQREDRSIANIHTGSKSEHESVMEAAPPEGEPPSPEIVVTPDEYTPGDPPPPIDPIDVEQQAAGDYVPEERPLDFELRARERQPEEAAPEDVVVEEEVERRREDDPRTESDEELIAVAPTEPEAPSIPTEVDDAPETPLAQNAVLDEDDLSGGTDGTGARAVTQPLIIDFGDDGAGDVRLSIPDDLQQMNIGQGGTPLSISLSEDGSQIQAVDSDNNPVFTVTLNEEGGEYSYTFELQGAIDHGDFDQVDLPIGISVTDSDGDTAYGEFSVGIVDDEPVARDDETQSLEEGGGTIGSEDGADNLLENDDLGADGALIFQFTYTDESGEEQTARAGETVDTEHGTLTVNADGSWSFEADPNADHTDGEPLLDGFTYSIVDADGDTSSATQNIEITDDGPSINFDGDGPKGGDSATLFENDIDGGDASVTQSLNIDFGADGEGTVTLAIPAELEEMGLTADGQVVEFALSEDGQSIVATADGEPVFTMSINEGEEGDFSYTFELQGNLDHPDAGSDLLSNLPFDIRVTDGDGSTATAEVNINVVDDQPEAVGEATLTIDEGGNTVGSDDGGSNLLANDDLGADGGEITSFTYTDESGVEQTAAAGETVDTENGTLTVNADGSWSFESDPNADHSDGAVSDGFTYTMTDGDGDTSSATQNITITDDGPEIPPNPPSPPPGGGDGDNPDLGRADLVVDEDSMGVAVSQDIEVDFGADGFGSAELSVPQALEDMNLTSGGEAITFTVSDDGQSIVAEAGGETVFTVELDADPSTGEMSYSVTLDGAVDHPDSGAGDDMLSNLPIELTVTDGDGTTATTNLEVAIVDDEPEATDEATLTIDEGGNTVGSDDGGSNLLANDDLGADGGEITSFTYTDESGVEQTAAAGETVDTENGTLTVNADGSWSFESDPNADHSDGAVSDGFTYTVTDGDGDTSSATQNITITDDGPEIPPNPPSPPPGGGDGDNPDLGRADLVVDEDSMGVAVSQDIEVDFGADGFGSAELSVPQALEDMNLTSGGEAITFTVSDDGQSIVAEAGGETVFTVELDADPSTGEMSYSVTLDGAVDHPDSGAGDDMLSNLPIELTVTDGDGTTATTNLEVAIVDDEPEATDEATLTIDEGGNTVGSDDGGSNLLANDDLGADGGEITSFTYTDESGVEQTAAAGETVDTENGTLTVNADGSWSFESDPNADHSDGDTVSDGFTYTITDGDGDTAEATQTIEITDDGPVIGPPPGTNPPGGGGGDGDGPAASGYSVTVDEDDLGNGAADGGQSLNIDFGADGEGSVQLEVPQELQDMNITSDGQAVTFSVSEDGQSVVGSTPDGNPVLTISLENNDGQYSYGVELHEDVDHSSAGEDVLSDIPVTLMVTDGDGDTASATLTVNVIDDAPVAQDDATVTLEEGGDTLSVSAEDGLLSNDDVGADGGEITSFTYTDEAGEQQTAEAGESVDTENGTLTVNADGSWSFESDPNADHSDGDTVSDGFTYTITDGDGDTAQATQTIEITDDGPVIGPPPGTNPPGGNPPGGDGGDDPSADGYSVTVDEDNIGEGASSDQALNIDFGADGEGSVQLEVPQELQGMNITSDGQAVTFTVSEDGQSVVGATPDGNPVMTISLENNDGQYSYGVELHENVDHGAGSDDVLSDIPVTLTVTDGDGDTASATLTVNVIDDAPEAVDDGTFDVQDGGQVIGTDNGADSLLSNDDLGADGAEITSITYTDENGDAQTVEVGEDGVTVDTEQGTLTVEPDGSWSFESDDRIESPDGSAVTDNFSYTITDGDGDTSSANVAINVSDGTVEPPEVVVGDAIGYEDEPIALNIDVSMVDTDGSESVSITISDIPDGAVLHDASGNEIDIADGSAEVSMDDLEGLTITPPQDSDIDFDLGVSVTTTEASTGETSTVETSFTVEVDAVADETTVSVSYDAKMVEPEPGSEPEPVVIDTHNIGDTDSGFRVVGRDIDGEVSADNVVTSGGAMGVGGSAVEGREVVPNQIGHNPETGEAEGLIVEFDDDVTKVDFSVSRLFQDEGDKRGDASGDEQGKVILYRDGEVVGEVEFTSDGKHTGSFTVQADDGGPFDAIEFTATEYSEGDGTQTMDSSDYFVDQISFTPAPEPGDGEPYCEVTVNVDATFGDFEDGSENHFVVVEVPEGWDPQGEYVEVDASDYGDGSGTFIAIPVDPADLQAGDGAISVPVTFETPVPDADGGTNLKVFAVAQEVNIDGTVGDGEITLDNNNTMSEASLEVEHKDMTVEDPNLEVEDASGYEDNAIPLNIDASLSDTDGSETMSITISDIPEGATLTDGDGNEITVTDGSADLSADQLEGLSITPPTDSDLDFDLSVSVTSTETNTGETSTVDATINVEVDAVADDTSVSATVEAQMVEGDSTPVTGDITISNTGISKAGFNNTYGYYLKDEDGNPTEGQIVYANVKEDGEPFTLEDVDPDRVGFFLLPDGDDVNKGLEDGMAVTFEQDDSGNWHVVGPGGDRLEGDGSWRQGGTQNAVFFSDNELNADGMDHMEDTSLAGNQNWEDLSADAPGQDNDYNDVNMQVDFTPTGGGEAEPHCEVTVNVDASFGDYSDGSEQHFVVVEVPVGWEPQGEYVEVDGSAYGDGNFIAVPVDASDLQESGGSISVPVTFETPVPDDDGSIDVNVFAVAQEVNIDGTVGDGEITLDNNNTMSQATVEVQKEDLVVEDPNLEVQDVSGYEDNAIPLNIDASLSDTDGSETISITISDIPEGAMLTDGDGNEIAVTDGSADLSVDQLEGLSITPPADSDVDFDLSVSVTSTETNTGETSTVDAAINVEVDAVADTTGVSAEVSATITPGEPGEPEEVTIGADNYDEADAGFTVAGRTIDGDGNLTDASTDQISVKSTGHPTGFGVKGDVGNGADSEIGYEDGKSEQVVITFDEDVSSADVTIAWQNPNEDCRVTLYRDGEPVGEIVVEGGTDRVDGLGAFTADDGGSFDSMVFEATGENSDFLIHEVSFETAGEPSPPSCDVQIDVSASFGDYTDGSEEHFVFVEVPEGMSPTDGDLQVIEGNEENGLPQGESFVVVPVDAADIEAGNGTVSVPVSFTGEVPSEDGSISADVFAGAVETNLDGGEITFDNNMSLTGTSVEIETKDMTVEDPNLEVQDASGYEDTAIPLNIDASLSDTDGSETLSITIGDIPEGATLTDGEGNEIAVTDGSADVSADQLEGLSITPPTDSDVDFDLSVSVTSTESSTGETSTVDATINVEVDAVADDNSVSATVETQLVEGDPGEGVSFTLGGRETDGSKSEMFDSFDQEVGGHSISVSAIKVDGSEGKLDGDVKGGEWRGIGVKGEGDSEIDFDKGGDGGSEQIAIDFDGMELNELTVGVKALFNEGEVADGQESGQWIAYHNGEPVASGDFHAADDSRSTDGALEINIGPDDLGDGVVFDEIRFEASEAGSDFLVQYVEGETPGEPSEPHCEVTVNVDATFGDFTDGSEEHFVFVEVPEGWEATGEGIVEADNGDYPQLPAGATFVKVPVSEEALQDGEGSVSVPVTFEAPASEAGEDVQIDVFSAAIETNLDGAELTTDNNVSFSGSSITVDGKDLTAEPPELTVSDAAGTEDTAIPLSIDAGLSDTDGSESLSVTISDIPEGATLTDGDGNEIAVTDGSADLSADQLEGLTITPPADSDVDFDLSVSVTSTESSTGETSTVEQSFTVEVDAVADDTSVSADVSVEITPGETVTETVSGEGTIDASNFDEGEQGFTVSARTLNEDGSLSDASTDNVSSGRNGLGVKGSASDGEPDAQLGYNPETETSEQLVIDFDHDVTEMSFSVSRLFADEGDKQSGGAAGNEQGQWAVYDDGELVATGTFENEKGNTGEFSIDLPEGASFDQVVFSATSYSEGDGTQNHDSSDFFIEDISFSYEDTVIVEETPASAEVTVNVDATFGDYQDGSEEHFVFVEVPEGWEAPEGSDVISGDEISSDMAGGNYVMIEVPAETIAEGDGSIEVPVTFIAPADADTDIQVDVHAGAKETNLAGEEATTENNFSLSSNSVTVPAEDMASSSDGDTGVAENADTSASSDEPSDDTGPLVIEENFDDGVSGWGNEAESVDGEMIIDKDETASKTFDFGADNAGQTVTITFDADTRGSWDEDGRNQDFLKVEANGESVLETSEGGENTHSITVQLDENGQVQLDITADTTGRREGISIDNLKIETEDGQVLAGGDDNANANAADGQEMLAAEEQQEQDESGSAAAEEEAAQDADATGENAEGDEQAGGAEAAPGDDQQTETPPASDEDDDQSLATDPLGDQSADAMGVGAPGEDSSDLSSGDISAGLEKFSSAPPMADDGGNQDTFMNVGAGRGGGDQGDWTSDQDQAPPMDDEVFGKSEMEQKEDEDQQAADAEREEQEGGLQIPADDNGGNEADFEDRSLM